VAEDGKATRERGGERPLSASLREARQGVGLLIHGFTGTLRCMRNSGRRGNGIGMLPESLVAGSRGRKKASLSKSDLNPKN